MNYLGDFAEDSVVRIFFTTHDKDGAAVAPSSALENADISIYKNGSVTKKSSVNGVVMTSPFDSVVGLHYLSIDTSNDTGDVGFWTTDGEFVVVLSPDETIDSEIVVSVIGSFSIERTGGAIAVLRSRLVGTILTGNHSPQSGDIYPVVSDVTYGLSTLEALVDDIESRLGVPSNLGSGATVAANLVDIEGQTDDIGVAGAGLTAIPISAASVDAILDDPVEGAITLRQAMRVVLAYLAGRATGGGTAAPKFRDQANTKDRISMTVDGVGNRSAVTLDLT
jgi:hypothetical protein